MIHEDQRSLLSGATCQELAWLIKMSVVNVAQSIEISNQYRDIFEGLGCLKKEYHIKMHPKVCHPHKAPKLVSMPLNVQLKDYLPKKGVVQPCSYRASSMHGSVT